MVPGSHRGGLTTPEGGVIPNHILRDAGAEGRALALPVQAGEVIDAPLDPDAPSENPTAVALLMNCVCSDSPSISVPGPVRRREPDEYETMDAGASSNGCGMRHPVT